MALTRGIQGNRSSTAAKPIKMESALPIGLVLLANAEPKQYYFDSPKKALEYFKSESSFFKKEKSTGGNWEKYLNLWEDRFPTTVPVLISMAKIGEGKTKEAVEKDQKSNVLTAITAMKNFTAEFGIQPDVTAVADYPRDINVLKSLDVINQFYKSRSWYDIDTEKGSDAAKFKDEVDSERISMVNSALGTFNTVTKSNEWYDAGVVMAFHRAYTDSKKEFAWFDSISNLSINMDSVKYPVSYHDGLDETDGYADKQIWTFIKDGGIRPWGSDYTCSNNPIWRNGSRVRLVDLAIKAIRKELRDSIDKDLSELTVVKKSLSAFKNGLIGQGVLLGGEIELDLEKTTPVEITAGNFYFIFDFQDTPKARKIVVRMNYTDEYSAVAYKILQEA